MIDTLYRPTPEQRANLKKLADYLAALPKDYEHFEIESYYKDGYDPVLPNEGPIEPSQCGAVACAIGHGPFAGIPVDPFHDAFWFNYARRVFGTDEGSYPSGSFMFGIEDHLGVRNPDCPHAAAERIYHVLSGEPLPDRREA